MERDGIQQGVQPGVRQSQGAGEERFAHLCLDFVAQPELGGLLDDVGVQKPLLQLDTRAQEQVLLDPRVCRSAEPVVRLLSIVAGHESRAVHVAVHVAARVQHAIVRRHQIRVEQNRVRCG